MSKFLNLKLDFLLYDSTMPTNDPADGERLKNRISDTSVSAASRQNPLSVATGASDQAISLPAATCNYLIVCVDQPVSVKVNGGSAQALAPSTPGVKTFALFLRGTITSLSVSNSSGVTANLDVIAIEN